MRKLIAGGLPAFGSCAGLIMLADRVADGVAGQQTFGGIDMTARRNAFGRQVDSFERDVTRATARRAVPRGVHPRAVGGAGRCAKSPCWARITVGSSPSGRVPLLATAFHPELTPDRRIHELFVKMVKGTS